MCSESVFQYNYGYSISHLHLIMRAEPYIAEFIGLPPVWSRASLPVRDLSPELNKKRPKRKPLPFNKRFIAKVLPDALEVPPTPFRNHHPYRAAFRSGLNHVRSINGFNRRTSRRSEWRCYCRSHDHSNKQCYRRRAGHHIRRRGKISITGSPGG